MSAIKMTSMRRAFAKRNQVRRLQLKILVDVERLDVMNFEMLRSAACRARRKLLQMSSSDRRPAVRAFAQIWFLRQAHSRTIALSSFRPSRSIASVFLSMARSKRSLARSLDLIRVSMNWRCVSWLSLTVMRWMLKKNSSIRKKPTPIQTTGGELCTIIQSERSPPHSEAGTVAGAGCE